MNIAKISGVQIEAIYACVPEIELDNSKELLQLYGEEVETVIKATGIKKRYIAKKGTSSLDLCCSCAQRLLEETDINNDDIGGVIFVTFTPEVLMPCNATGVQERLKLSKDIPAFDIGLACSGYGYGLWMASIMAKTYNKKILLLDGDIQSAFMSGKDKSTLPVMADAGSATLVSPSEDLTNWYFTFYTDGSRREELYIPAGGSGRPVEPEDLELSVKDSEGSQRRNLDIYMDGFGIFKFVAQDVVRLLKEFIEETDFSPEEIDFFVPHQANIFMIKQLARKINVKEECMWISGDEVGNSASATIPVTIAKCAEKALGNNGTSRILFSGFGGGLSMSAGLIELKTEAKYKLFQYK